MFSVYLTIIPRGRVGYEMIESQRGAQRRVGYNHLISNKREWNNCFIKKVHKFSLNLLLLLLREYTGVVNNPSSTKLSYSKLKNAVLNPSKSFLALKKVNPGFCRLLKDRSLKKWEKHQAHTLSTRQEVNIVEQSEIANQSDCLYHQDH